MKALLTMSLREELTMAAGAVGANKAVLNDEAALGAQAELLQDITTAFMLKPHLARHKGLRVAAWSQPGRLMNNALPATISQKLSRALDLTVEAHLTARAGHSLAQDEIGSIRRLRVTKGIYLPSDTPMHVICGSKDVIHS